MANGFTISPIELGYIDGLTSNAQAQINAKATDANLVHLSGTETITGDKTFSGTTTISGSIIANGFTISPTELGYIDGLTSNVQTQINAKATDTNLIHLSCTETITGSKTLSGTTTITGNTIANGFTISPTELGYIDGLTSNAQAQLTSCLHNSGFENASGTKEEGRMGRACVGREKLEKASPVKARKQNNASTHLNHKQRVLISKANEAVEEN